MDSRDQQPLPPLTAASQNQPPPLQLHNMMMHLGLGSSQPSGSVKKQLDALEIGGTVSGKKQLDALETGGSRITPHVVHVYAGEDIAARIIAFSQEIHRTVCIFSAIGHVCSVMLKPNASFEGRYEIITLSGSFLFEKGVDIGVYSGLSVSLAGLDCQIFGGRVAGTLIAATPIQVFVGSFVDSQQHHTQMLNFGGTEPVASSPDDNHTRQKLKLLSNM